MNYFDQIIIKSEDNALSLIGLNNSTLTDQEKKILFKRNVEIINLELSYQCNRKCDYCPVSESTRKTTQKIIDTTLLSKICKELQQIRYENRISLNLYNEPLLDPSLENKIKLIKAHLPHCHIGFNTNGDKLTLDRLQSLSDAGCDSICITLHPPANKIQSSSTILKRIRNFCTKFKSTLPTEPNPLEINHLNIRSSGVNLKIQWPNWRISGTNRAGTATKQSAIIPPRQQPCIKPFREFTIYHNGIIQTCCEAFHDDQTNIAEMGDINKISIFQAYMSRELTKFRSELFDFSPKSGICKLCGTKDYSHPQEDRIRKTMLSKIPPY